MDDDQVVLGQENPYTDEDHLKIDETSKSRGSSIQRDGQTTPSQTHSKQSNAQYDHIDKVESKAIKKKYLLTSSDIGLQEQVHKLLTNTNNKNTQRSRISNIV